MRTVFSPYLFRTLFFLHFVFTFTCLSDVMHSSGTGFTKDAALTNALKLGMKRKIKTIVPPLSYKNNVQLIHREIISRVFRYISDTNIVSMNKEFGCFQVEVTAHIDNLKVKKTLQEHGIEVHPVSKPGIVILIDEYHQNERLSEATAALKVKKILRKQGYTIIDTNPTFPYLSSSGSSNEVRTDDLAHFGIKSGADLIIRGIVKAAQAAPVNVYGKKQMTVPVQMNVEIIRTDNAAIIGTNTLTLRRNAITEYSALHNAIKSAAAAMGKEIGAELDSFCESDDYTARHIDLVMHGIDYARADEIESDIKKIPSVQSVKLRYLENQKAVYDISFDGPLKKLRKEISSGTIDDLIIRHITPGRITAVCRKGSAATDIHPAVPAVKVGAFHIEELYPSKLRHYATHPVGMITLTTSVPVSAVHLSLSLPELLRHPFYLTKEYLSPGKHTFDLFILPDYELLVNRHQTRAIQGRLELQYSVDGKSHVRVLTVPVVVHGHTAMNWEHPEAIASFITNNDPVVRRFTRQVVRDLSYDDQSNRDFINAVAVYEAVRKYGVSYVKDPSPDSDRLIDKVQYPVQTLFQQTGDCEDLSVLYCSLLSSLGIPVALIVYDSHVCFMFGTGMFEKNRLALSPDTTHVIAHDKKLWIPIEATDMSSAFVDNWHTTARKFKEAINAGRNVHIIDIKEAWKRYPPVSLFREKFEFAPQPVKDEVHRQLTIFQDKTARLYLNEITRLRSIKKKDIADPAAHHNNLGLLYIHCGDYRNALKSFKQACGIKNSPEMQSNYACALLLSNKTTEALRIFDNIYKKEHEGKIAINRALCNYVTAKDSTGNQGFFTSMLEAALVIGSDATMAEILGFEITDRDSLRASNSSRINDIPTLDIDVLRQHIKAAYDIKKHGTFSGTTTESSSGSRITGTTTETSTGSTADKMIPKHPPFGGLRGAPIEVLRRLVDLLYWFEL